MQTHQIKFKSEAHHRGLNNTIRSGKKWLEARPGDKLELVLTDDPDGYPFGEAIVIAAVAVTLEELEHWDQTLLQWNHSPCAREYENLAEKMLRAYGPNWINEPIVVLWYWY